MRAMYGVMMDGIKLVMTTTQDENTSVALFPHRYYFILISSYPHILISSYPHILISSYPHILISSYPHILISSYPHILISLRDVCSTLWMSVLWQTHFLFKTNYVVEICDCPKSAPRLWMSVPLSF
jgi:hypothetical protein